MCKHFTRLKSIMKVIIKSLINKAKHLNLSKLLLNKNRDHEIRSGVITSGYYQQAVFQLKSKSDFIKFESHFKFNAYLFNDWIFTKSKVNLGFENGLNWPNSAGHSASSLDYSWITAISACTCSAEALSLINNSEIFLTLLNATYTWL